ncbi:hypothetical protein BDR06DRAFT_973992 [Suillus hirtellus]|nr:hypothetical protein BDR06DRAFT_973992 [Suillus hirtellus]
MSHPAPAKHRNSATMPYRKFKVKGSIGKILHLPGGQRIITTSSSDSLRVWDLETGTQVEEWEVPVKLDSTVLSPDGKTLAIGSCDDGVVKLWSIDTGKITLWRTVRSSLRAPVP